MKNLSIISFVIMSLSTIAIGLFSSYGINSLAIVSIRIFALSGIVCSISDLLRGKSIWIYYRK